MQCLDRADLDRRARARRKAGLDDADVKDPDIKESRYCLLRQLDPVGDEHHLLATRDCVIGDRTGNDGFARPGRRHEADAAMVGANLGPDAGNDIALILPQLGRAH